MTHCCYHLKHPFTLYHSHQQIKGWQKCVAVGTGVILLPFLVIPSLILFYGLTNYFKSKTVAKSTSLSSTDEKANSISSVLTSTSDEIDLEKIPYTFIKPKSKAAKSQPSLIGKKDYKAKKSNLSAAGSDPTTLISSQPPPSKALQRNLPSKKKVTPSLGKNAFPFSSSALPSPLPANAVDKIGNATQQAQSVDTLGRTRIPHNSAAGSDPTTLISSQPPPSKALQRNLPSKKMVTPSLGKNAFPFSSSALPSPLPANADDKIGNATQQAQSVDTLGRTRIPHNSAAQSDNDNHNKEFVLQESLHWPKVKQDKRYYFIPEDCKSYRLKTLVKAAILALPENSDKKFPSIISPEGNEYSIVLWQDENIDDSILELIRKIKNDAIIDWTRTSRNKECSLSLDVFKKPYIVNLTGRSYSKKAILQAIASSLLKDGELRLEDSTLKPHCVDELILYPNYSLWNKEPREMKIIKFTAADIEVRLFDEKKIQDILGFSTFLKILPPTDGDFFDLKQLYNFYADARKLPHFTSNHESIENVSVQNVIFPPYHPKMPAGHITFTNILFNECTIKMQCWCGISVKSSQFVDCEIDLTEIYRSPIVRRSKFVNCNFVIQTNQLKKGKYKDIEKYQHILHLLKGVVDEIGDLANCTLQVV